jgi:hypothetical protein
MDVSVICAWRAYLSSDFYVVFNEFFTKNPFQKNA